MKDFTEIGTELANEFPETPVSGSDADMAPFDCEEEYWQDIMGLICS